MKGYIFSSLFVLLLTAFSCGSEVSSEIDNSQDNQKFFYIDKVFKDFYIK